MNPKDTHYKGGEFEPPEPKTYYFCVSLTSKHG